MSNLNTKDLNTKVCSACGETKPIEEFSLIGRERNHARGPEWREAIEKYTKYEAETQIVRELQEADKEEQS